MRHPSSTRDEAVEIARRVIERADVPVVVGVSAPGFAAMRSLTAAVMDEGAAGVMIAPPHTLRTDDRVVGYYAGAAPGDRGGDPLRHPGLPAHLQRADVAGHDRPHRPRQPGRRHAQARGLAGAGEDHRPA
uniref:Uncharacterized protein n=1 Tax=Janibacter limosus TaxID=53458 RepID=A0AC61U2G4_9MICO|nr:hypothetical protein [Janibacter limosus]